MDTAIGKDSTSTVVYLVMKVSTSLLTVHTMVEHRNNVSIVIINIDHALHNECMPHNTGGLNITIDPAMFLPGFHTIDIVFFPENFYPTSGVSFRFTVEGIQ